ncbi:MAG TPA: response regulator [Candidatus Krumholzibacteria bacterium]|nr:response regulator [Candidatus Krumholzibacteria bacterium]
MSRILVVDVSPYFRARTRALLESRAHEVLEAIDVRTAVQCVFREAPDAVVLDLIVPEQDGLDLLRELRRRGFVGPRIVVTADRQPMTRHLALAHGATALLPEPVDAETLLEHVEEGGVLV